MIVLLAGLAAQAATNYGIKVAGVNVTSDNASGVTGTNISGSVTYNNSTKTLTMTNVTINLTSGSERALLNTGCSGLTVKFVGTCTLKTTNKAPIRSKEPSLWQATITRFKLSAQENSISAPQSVPRLKVPNPRVSCNQVTLWSFMM